jgi:hypothetical protein
MEVKVLVLNHELTRDQETFQNLGQERVANRVAHEQPVVRAIREELQAIELLAERLSLHFPSMSSRDDLGRES